MTSPAPQAGEPVTALRESPPTPTPDTDGAERAAACFPEALGAAADGEAMAGTPGRIARAYAEMLTPRASAPTTFPTDERYDEPVLARAIGGHSVRVVHERDHLGPTRSAARRPPLPRGVPPPHHVRPGASGRS